MGKLHKLKRNDGEITVEVLHKGKVINGKFYPRGYVHVKIGMVGEEYAFPYEVARSNYTGDADFDEELERANQEVDE